MHGDTKHPDSHVLSGALRSPDTEVNVDGLVVESSEWCLWGSLEALKLECNTDLRACRFHISAYSFSQCARVNNRFH